jgi:hypothetical protein
MRQLHLTVTNSLLLIKRASFDTRQLIIFTCRSPKVAGEALDVVGSYFVIPTLADFSDSIWKEVRHETSSYHTNSFSRHHRKRGGATESTNKKQGEGEKQILIDQRVLENRK